MYASLQFHSRFVLLSLALSFAGCTHSGSNTSPNTSPNAVTSQNAAAGSTTTKYAAELDKLFESALDRGIFNGNVLIEHKGSIVYQAQWGWSNASRQESLKPDALFNVGSIVKEFSGVALMMLVERGQIDLTDSLSQFDLGLGDWDTKVQIKHLLQYTSGLPKIDWRRVESDQDIFEDLRKLSTPRFEPGTDYFYANTNVFLVRRIVEAVSGQPYNDFIRGSILKPCKMKDTVIDAPEEHPRLVQAFNSEGENVPRTIEMSGDVYPTNGDLHRFVRCLHDGRLLSATSVNVLREKFGDGQSPLGWSRWGNDRLLEYGHHGSTDSFESFFRYDLENDLLMVLTTNNLQFQLQPVTDAVQRVFTEQPYDLPLRSIFVALVEIATRDPDVAIERYRQLRLNEAGNFDFSDESDLNQIGYRLLGANNPSGAIKIFELALEVFPSSANLHDSLGDARLQAGDPKGALEMFEHALKLDDQLKETQEKAARLRRAAAPN